MKVLEIIRFDGEETALKGLVDDMVNSGDMKLVQEEDGCIYFDFFFAAEKKGLLLLEKWENDAALDRHHGTGMMADLLELIKKYDLKLAVEKYSV